MEFAYDGGGLGKGGTVTLYLDGDAGRRGPVDATVPMIFSADETTDVGTDSGTPVSDDWIRRDALHRAGATGSRSTSATTPRTPITCIAPEERLRVAMARQ